jgi:cation transporter-like permease
MFDRKKARPIPRHVVRKIQRHPRKKFHPHLHSLRKHYGLSKRTFFYMKEYGPHSHVASNIVRESIKILILASVLSSVGGFGLQGVQASLVAIVPLLVLLPALSDMIGDFGTIMASKFTTALFLGHIPLRKWWRSRDLHVLFHVVMSIAIIASIYNGLLAYGIAYFKGFAFDAAVFVKVMEISIFSTLILVSVIFLISVVAGLWIYRKGEDPNNFLIPITTSVADLGSLLIFSGMILLFFG